MKKFLYATVAVALLSFAACSKTDEQPAVKKLVKSTSTYKNVSQDVISTTTYQYNPDGLLAEENTSSFYSSKNETILRSQLYNYTPNLLTVQSKDKDGKITSTLFCHLNKKSLLTVDSTDDTNAYFYEYDSKNRITKFENIDLKTKKANSTYTYTYQGDKLTERKDIYVEILNDSKTETVRTYFYDKNIKNTLSNAAQGMTFNGLGNLYAATKTVDAITEYTLSTGKLKSTTQSETEHSYELDANGFIIKKGTKSRTGQNPWSEERFITYEYEK